MSHHHFQTSYIQPPFPFQVERENFLSCRRQEEFTMVRISGEIWIEEKEWNEGLFGGGEVA